MTVPAKSKRGQKKPLSGKPSTPSKARKPQKPSRIKTGSNGRPSDYRPEYANECFDLCLAGFTDKMLADTFGVSENTIGAWKKKYPEFLGAMRKGKSIANGKVARSLYERAVGYTTTEEHLVKAGSKSEVITTAKQHPPDVQAQRIFLRNRMPEQWGEKLDVGLGNKGGEPLKIKRITPDMSEKEALRIYTERLGRKVG